MSTKLMTAASIESDTDYSSFEKLVAARVADATGPLFTTDADSLGLEYLAAIPPEHRQHYTCKACLAFLEKYGGLASILADGRLDALLWRDYGSTPPFFANAVAALDRKVTRAKVTGVFLNADEVWGKPRTGEWTHLSGAPPSVFHHSLKTASQLMAEKREDYITLRRGMTDYPVAAVEQAVRVLGADALDRSEKTLGIAQWFLDLHRSIRDVKGPARDNLVWLAVAKAPPGFCHVRSTMIATLLDDIVAGLDFDTISRRWAQKMHPLQYQRPTTVTTGAIEQANKMMEQLGASGALARRFARRADLVTLWEPKSVEAAKPAGKGVFDHLRVKAGAPLVQTLELPPVPMTWAKFRATVLPDALSMQVQVPHTGPFYGMVTAVDPSAPPLLQWDGLDGQPRNPVSWYFYHSGSTADRWGLVIGWTEVACICLAPPHWHAPEKFSHVNQMAHFVLEGARDTQYVKSGCFFPECLRSDFHGVRSVMEAYAQEAAIAGRDEGDANGIAFQKGGTQTLLVRVRTAQGLASYQLDRWD